MYMCVCVCVCVPICMSRENLTLCPHQFVMDLTAGDGVQSEQGRKAPVLPSWLLHAWCSFAHQAA